MLPPESRLPDLAPLIEEQAWFVVHAPRQTGKTTAMRALAARLRAEPGTVAVCATLETSQGVESVQAAEPLWMEAIAQSAGFQLPPDLVPPPIQAAMGSTVGQRFQAWLHQWCRRMDQRLVLLLDEADVVTGPALISLLRQLRAGFVERGVGRFPTTVALVGMRDLRDYVVDVDSGPGSLHSGSPFNIKSASITLRPFSSAEVAELLGQHTAATGQAFNENALDRIFELTAGQPFLVNAIARWCVEATADRRHEPITVGEVNRARDRLTVERTTHLDSLAQRLKDPRVATVVQAVILGDQPVAYDSDDFEYVVDLGLLVRDGDGARPANPIYRDVLVRQLSYNIQENLRTPWWSWRTADGRLDMDGLVRSFLAWWRENAEVLPEQQPNYPEALPHLAFMAFLQRVVNGGGSVHREYAAGRGAIDLLVEYGPDRFAIELKRVRPRDSLSTQRRRGIEQLTRYMQTLDVASGWLLVFDVRPRRTWEQRLWVDEVIAAGRTIRVYGA
jgi:hypothetical protein